MSVGEGVVVVDSSVALGLLLDLPYSERCAALFEAWKRAYRRVYAPLLWEYEVVSTLRKAVALRAITPARAIQALDQVPRLGVTRVAPDPDLNRAALDWARRLGQSVAYDAQYLALAERLDAELWTADRRLASGASSIGATFVHCLLGD